MRCDSSVPAQAKLPADREMNQHVLPIRSPSDLYSSSMAVLSLGSQLVRAARAAAAAVVCQLQLCSVLGEKLL